MFTSGQTPGSLCSRPGTWVPRQALPTRSAKEQGHVRPVKPFVIAPFVRPIPLPAREIGGLGEDQLSIPSRNGLG